MKRITAKQIIGDRCAPKPLVQAYRNLNIRDHVAYSVRSKKTGRVVAHEPVVVVSDADLKVQPGGRARVLRTKRKAVHAFVEGCLEKPTKRARPLEPIRYNPYLFSSFVTANKLTPVTQADLVVLDKRGARAKRPR
jgi:hypothetical protein